MFRTKHLSRLRIPQCLLIYNLKHNFLKHFCLESDSGISQRFMQIYCFKIRYVDWWLLLLFSQNNANSFYRLAFNSDHKDIESIFQDFQEMENISSDSLLSKEENFCETHFQKAQKRNETEIISCYQLYSCGCPHLELCKKSFVVNKKSYSYIISRILYFIIIKMFQSICLC